MATFIRLLSYSAPGWGACGGLAVLFLFRADAAATGGSIWMDLLAALAGALFGLALLIFYRAWSTSAETQATRTRDWPQLLADVFASFPIPAVQVDTYALPPTWQAVFLCRLFNESRRLHVFQQTYAAAAAAVTAHQVDDMMLSLALQAYIATSPAMSPEDYRELIRVIKNHPSGNIEDIQAVAKASRQDKLISAVLAAAKNESLASYLITSKSVRQAKTDSAVLEEGMKPEA
ncbi:MAG: hypothetical protein ACREJ2_13330 [Planctomycetota bacterium]